MCKQAGKRLIATYAKIIMTRSRKVLFTKGALVLNLFANKNTHKMEEGGRKTLKKKGGGERGSEQRQKQVYKYIQAVDTTAS